MTWLFPLVFSHIFWGGIQWSKLDPLTAFSASSVRASAFCTTKPWRHFSCGTEWHRMSKKNFRIDTFLWTITPQKPNIATQNSYVWKEIHLPNHHVLVFMLVFRGATMWWWSKKWITTLSKCDHSFFFWKKHSHLTLRRSSHFIKLFFLEIVPKMPSSLAPLSSLPASTWSWKLLCFFLHTHIRFKGAREYSALSGTRCCNLETGKFHTHQTWKRKTPSANALF